MVVCDEWLILFDYFYQQKLLVIPSHLIGTPNCACMGSPDVLFVGCSDGCLVGCDEG